MLIVGGLVLNFVRGVAWRGMVGLYRSGVVGCNLLLGGCCMYTKRQSAERRSWNRAIDHKFLIINYYNSKTYSVSSYTFY